MRAKTVNFQRGQNPKSALDIGVIRSITSDDLSLLQFGWIYDEQRFDEEEFKKESGEMKTEVKQELPKIGQSLWEKFKELIK